MKLVNHLKSSEAQRRVLAVASGKHVVRGHLIYSYVTGTETSYRITLRQALGKGTWNRAVAVYYNGLVIPPSDYIFHSGRQTSSGEKFPTDNAHTGTVMIDVTLPENVGEFDTENNPPQELVVICECELFPDFDAVGNQINEAGATVRSFGQLLAGAGLDEDAFFYTVNPANVLSGWMFKYGSIDFDRINWEKYVSYRNYCAQTEEADYTSVPEFEGFGLTGNYFNGAGYAAFVKNRLDASIYFALSAGAPASGVDPDNFSVYWKGFLKPEFSETYNLELVHTGGVRLWVDNVLKIDELSSNGTHSVSIPLAAGTYYLIHVEWVSGAGEAEIIFRWSAPSVPAEIIKPKNLYPAITDEDLYQAHLEFSTPTTMDQAIDAILFATNSIRQDINGKIEFYCIEQLAQTFHFDSTLPLQEQIIIPGTFSFERSDTRITSRQNVFEGEFRDLDSEYLEKPANPVRVTATDLVAIAGREIYGSPVPLPNMKRWQAYKVIARIAKIAVIDDLKASFEATGRAFTVVAGDKVGLTHPMGAFVNKPFQVTGTIDYSPEEQEGKRKFTLQEI